MTAWSVSRAIGEMRIERRRDDGSAGCCAPCVGCCMALQKLNIRLKYTDDDGRVCTVRSSDLEPARARVVTSADAVRWGRA